MKKHRKLLALALVTVLVLAFATPALAAPSDEEKAANGHTTIGIYETTIDPALISFEVPLYVTMAAVQGETAVRVPTNYGIKNTSQGSTNIGVTGVEFGTVRGGTWATVAGTPTGKQIQLSIGDISIPAIAANDGTLQSMTLTGSVFRTTPGDKATSITPGATLNVPLSGTIANNAVTGAVAAAPQFRVKYTVAALTPGGDPAVADPYAGDDSNLAGFGTWNPGTGGFTPAP